MCSAGLTDFNGTDIRKPKDSTQLEPQLSFVEVPETFRQAVQVAATNLVESQFDGRDIATVINVELNRGQDEGDGAAEDENARQ